MSWTIDAIDAKSGAVPQSSRNSLAVTLLRQILQRMQKVNANYNVYTYFDSGVSDFIDMEKQMLIENPYRCVSILQFIKVPGLIETLAVTFDSGSLAMNVITADAALALIGRGINVTNVPYVDLNVAPTNPLTVAERTFAL